MATGGFPGTYSESLEDTFGLGGDNISASTSSAYQLISKYNYPHDGIGVFRFFSDECQYSDEHFLSLFLFSSSSFAYGICKSNVVWTTSFLDTEFFVPYGYDNVSYTVYVPIEDIFAFSDNLSYSQISDIFLMDIFPSLGDNIEKFSLFIFYKDLLSLNDILRIFLSLRFASEVFFSDDLSLSFLNFFSDVFSLNDIYSFSPIARISDILSVFLDNVKLNFSLRETDAFVLFDLFSFSAIVKSLFEDFLFFTDLSIPFGKPEARIFFSLIPYSENLFYSLYSTSIRVTGIDGILTAEDGIYIFDEERTTGDLMFRFGDMSSSRLKRIDKIFASTPLEKATVYADESSYSYIGNKWISCGKGLKGKELKVLLENLGDIEFVSFRLVELRRPK